MNLTPEQKDDLKFKARVIMAKRYAERGDVLNWGKTCFPDKFTLPFCKELHQYFVDIKDEPFTSTLAPRGHAKCLDGETLIYGTFGIKKIKDIKEGDVVFSINENNKITKQKVLAQQGGQFKKGYILKTRTGREIKLSDEHPLFTFEGYKPIEQIKIGDYIGSLNSIINNKYEINENELKVISYMIFEGCCTNRTITFAEIDLLNDFNNSCQQIDINISKKKNSKYDYRLTSNRTSKVYDLLKKYNINNQLCYTKRLPASFFRMSYRQKMIFISIMIDTDGFVSLKAGNIGVTLANKELIKDIQLLLMSCGIISSLNKRKNKKAGAWGLTVNGSYAKQILKDGFVICKKEKLKQLLKVKRYSLFDIYPNKIKKNILNIERLARDKGIRIDNKYEITKDKLERLSLAFPDCKEFKKQLNQNIFWDKVIEIKRIDEIQEYFDIQVEKTQNFIANGFVSHNTTIKCFLIPIFIALNTPERFSHYLNIQATSTKAQAVNIAIKQEIEDNEVLRAIYGDQQTKIKWTERQFVLANGVIFSAIGAGESVRGINWRNKRPDYIVIDDLYDDDQIGKKDQITKLNSWFWRSVYKCVSPSKRNSIHIQGTAFAKYDLMHELAGKEGIVFKKFQAVNYETQTVLWVELNTFAQLMADKAKMGSSIFSREMQNEVRSEETAIIKEEWIKFYDVIPEDQKIVKTIIGIDPSIGANAENDYTGGAVCLVTVDPLEVLRWYFVQLTNDHLSMQKRIDLMQELHARHKADIIVIEAIAGFQDFSNETIRTTNLPIKVIKKTIDKLVNLELQQNKFENGKVFFKMGAPNVELAVEQLTENKPEHDDVRDAIIVCLKEDVSIPSFEVL